MKRGVAEVRARRGPAGEIIGTEIRHGAKVFALGQFPKRIREIEQLPDGRLRVDFEEGHSRLLEPEDAIR